MSLGQSTRSFFFFQSLKSLLGRGFLGSRLGSSDPFAFLHTIDCETTCLGRYLAAVLNGMKNPHRSAIAADIRNSVIKSPAQNGKPATYWSQPEQEKRLEEAFDKWMQKGGCWSAAAIKVSFTRLQMQTKISHGYLRSMRTK